MGPYPCLCCAHQAEARASESEPFGPRPGTCPYRRLATSAGRPPAPRREPLLAPTRARALARVKEARTSADGITRRRVLLRCRHVGRSRSFIFALAGGAARFD